MHPVLAAQLAEAARVLPEDARQYYAGGAGDQLSVGEAERSWQQVRLRPRVLRDVSRIDTGLDLLGSRLGTPVLAEVLCALALGAGAASLAQVSSNLIQPHG